MAQTARRSGIDRITRNIIGNVLLGVAREMGVTMRRTSYSNIFNEGYDYTCGIFDRAGNIIAQDEHVPILIASMEITMRYLLEEYRDQIHEGDIFIQNDPFTGGCHLPDIALIKPVFVDGELVCFVANRGHHIDVGGMRPGSFSGDCTEIIQEGLRFPAVKLYERGQRNEALWKVLLANVRLPRYTRGDMGAQVASINIGERSVRQVFAKYGRETVLQAMAELLDYGEEFMRREIGKIPAGTYTFEDYFDPDTFSPEPYRIKLAVTVGDGDITFDFTGTDPKMQGPLNINYASLCGAVYIAMLSLTSSEIPRNSGAYRPIRIIAPEGTLVHAQPPSAVVGGTTEGACRIINMIWCALAPAIPDRIIPSHADTTNNYNVSGMDPRTGVPYLWYQFPPSGWGARASKDGLSACISITGGDTSNTPMEALETQYPWIMEKYGLAQDSGGPGQQRGGLAVEWILRPYGHSAQFSCSTDRALIPPNGIFGGMPGLHAAWKVFRNCSEVHLTEDGLRQVAEREEDFGARTSGKFIHPADILYCRPPGGGGYGNPFERPVELVEADILNGYVSVAAARRDYGVVWDAAQRCADRQATAELRRQLAHTRREILVDQHTQPYARLSARMIRRPQ